MRKLLRGLGLALLIWGAVLILFEQVSITGFTIVEELNIELRVVFGMILVVGGIVIFSLSRSTTSRLEREVSQKPLQITSSVKNDPALYRSAQELSGKERIQSEINHLINELSKGNRSPGLGTDHLDDAGPVWYLRGRNGSRVFYIKHERGYEIVGYADKASEDKVINRLRQLYGHSAGK